MPVSPKLAAFLLLAPPVAAIWLVKWWLPPRRLEAWSFVTIPLLGFAAGVLALVAELMVIPQGLKQRAEDLALLAGGMAITEELTKALVLAWALRRRRATLIHRESILATGLLVGLGCSFLENVVRTFGGTINSVSLLVCLGRGVLSTPGHAAYTGLLAWMIARTRIDHDRAGGITLGLVLATVTHFAYDSIGLAPQLAAHAVPVEVACRSAQALIVYASLARVLRRSNPGSETPSPAVLERQPS